ncbi:endospore germination permease [Brevibacillus sp. GCM10020057]|uniref:GerAB/ArcD/ProY family transporter n=1 Tax=Brevibacillus sp. GCM10020057 TaxID=3317327 RepID=UPI00362E9E3C
MIHKQVVNHRQIAWMVGSVLLTGMLISFFRSVTEIAKMDAWFSQVLPVGYAMLVAYVLAEMTRAYPGKNMFEIIFIVFGKWAGGVVNFVLLLYFWIILTLEIKGATKFFHATLLPQTPVEITLLVLVLMIMYYGKTSLEVAARVNEMYFPVFFLLAMAMYVMLSNEYSIERLEPILNTSLTRIFISNFMTVGIYGDILLFGAFLHASTQSRLFFAALKHGILIVGFVATILLSILLGVMGYTIASRLNFPLFILIQQIHFTDFLDRVEIVLFSIWFPAFAIKVIVTYLAFLVGLGSFGGQANYTVFNFPAGWFIIAASLFAFRCIPDLDEFLSYSLPPIVLILQIPLLLVLYIKSRMSRKESEQACIQEGTKLYRFYRYCVWLGRIAMTASVLTIIIGSLLLNKSKMGGIITAICYVVFFFLALLASYAEMQALNHGKQKLSRKKKPGSFRQ